jgi:hypothetical protein
MNEQKHPKDYTHDEVVATCEAMHKFGGGFARHISNACLVADNHNRQTLLTAFAGLFVKYGPGTDFKERK